MIVQARMGSTRLPGKVLADVCGRPLLMLLLDRLDAAQTPAAVIVATTTNPIDDPIAALCEQRGTRCFRGDPLDVLQRYVDASADVGAEIVARISADSPFIDGPTVDAVVAAFADLEPDIAQNHRPQDWPFGTAVEVFSRETLLRISRSTDDARLREHVTLYAYENPGEFAIHHVEPPPEYLAPDLPLCVDTPSDLERIRFVWAEFGGRPDVPLASVIERFRGRAAELERQVHDAV